MYHCMARNQVFVWNIQLKHTKQFSSEMNNIEQKKNEK